MVLTVKKEKVMFNKMLSMLSNVDLTDNYDAKLDILRLQAENEVILGLTNKRKLRDYDGKSQKILKGYSFIESFINRGININSKSA